MNIYEHWTRVTRFNPLWVSGLTSCSLGLSKQQHCTCIMLFFLHTFKPSNFAISVGREQKATTSVYFSEIRNSLLEFKSRKGRQHLTKWRANKFKIARIHSLSDVFAAVIAVVVNENEILTTARRKFYLQGCLVPRHLSLNRARKGRREGAPAVCTLHGPLRFITSHSFRARLCHAKNEAPEGEAASKANENEMEYEYDFSYLLRGLNLLVSKCNWTTWNITGFTNFEKLYSYSNLIAKKIRRLSSRHLVNTQFTQFEVSLREIYHIIYCHQCTHFAENGLSNDRGVTVNKKNIHRLRLFDKKGLF